MLLPKTMAGQLPIKSVKTISKGELEQNNDFELIEGLQLLSYSPLQLKLTFHRCWTSLKLEAAYRCQLSGVS
jgi:hypothetical protein